MDSINESLLREEYLFESYLHDIHGKDPTGLYFIIHPREREGTPHVHVANIAKPSKSERKSKKYFECCIQLDYPCYFNHEDWHHKPNNDLRDKIVKYLLSVQPESRGQVWKFCRKVWLDIHYGEQASEDLRKMHTAPDYWNKLGKVPCLPPKDK